jgi:hypothetical protein
MIQKLVIVPVGAFFICLLLLLASLLMQQAGSLTILEASSVQAELNVLQINTLKLPLHTPLPDIGTSLSDAYATHAAWEINFVRKCFEDRGGALRIWREEFLNLEGKRNFRFHLICLAMDNITFVDRIVQKINGKWEEITSFIPKDGTLASLEKWLSRKIGKLWIDPLP